MNLTRHAEYRLEQRVIDSRLVDLCHKYGRRVPNNYGRLLLKESDIPRSELEGASAAMLSHVEKQLPICCAFTDDGFCITAFRVNGRICKRRSI